MSIIIIYTVISFLLDGLISNYISIDIANPSYLRTIYSVIALVIIYNYFENDRKYLRLLLSIGFLFDIVYTNTLLLNIFSFFIIYIINRELNTYIPNNVLTINIKALIAITIYHLITYLLLLLSHYDIYPLKLLPLILCRSIIMTVIYATISYLVINKLYYLNYYKKIK